ncbi:MAG: DNA polymerase IV [Deltaproteobacteria bacterium]|nr:DNA polymerase IV [Deltaproteobacteria bacterium]
MTIPAPERRAPRVVAHVDLDAFYASVEIRDRPELAGRPVVVGGEGRRSVVAAASYAARRFGVHSAMPMARARKLCPELVIVPPRMGHYARESASFFTILGRWSPLVEGLSLDEAFLDLTGTGALFGDPEDAIRRLRAEVRSELGLACSAGIAPVKFVAKIASDVAKPDGQVRIHEADVLTFLHPLPVGRLWGVGDKREAELHALGIRTIGDLATWAVPALAAHLGPHAAAHLVELAHGRDPRTVEPDHDMKSMGHEETFERDLSDLPLIETHLLAQAERVAARLRAGGVVARGVTLKYKLSDFTLVTRQTTFRAPTDDGPTLFRAVRALLAAHPPKRPIRLCGVSATRLEPAAAGVLPGLLSGPAPGVERTSRLNAALDAIAQRHGAELITRAALVDLHQGGVQNIAEPTRDRRPGPPDRGPAGDDHQPSRKSR